MQLTPLKDYQERIPLRDLQVGDFLDEVDPLPPARNARNGVRGGVFKSRVTKWDVDTGVLETVSSHGLPIRIIFRDHTCVIRTRVAA